MTLSRFSARFEELDNRLFLLAGREYYIQVIIKIDETKRSIRLFILVNEY